MIATPTMMPMNNTPRPVKNIPGIARSAPRLSTSYRAPATTGPASRMMMTATMIRMMTNARSENQAGACRA
jgi:hypothetical protein